MLHLSFTQQLCHVATLQKTDSAANDPTYNVGHEDERREKSSSNDASSHYEILKRFASAYFNRR
ncbi:hypothetical protein A3715_07425 [Oleiphilus sp. HI0009]|uniref:hypothetical protein n=1 Tax=unclassified Oleiphilus TaxID=2631174 RepID=UPI0007C328EC|nr:MULTISPECIES: hypothetical protein [unclassified Oleiphilus]KZX81354.1 hypothetical protein A3715_07425 [Oleiphilus sp. HI0009]KZY63277.1 hypothetical protein A3738_12145 [Oleiphilus sp. HI0066]KZY70810.1 hypothetical protein A3739_06050 [Oleiphilus sp. HI0067]KZY76131.1 hypothetical protein A3739_23695 [Oleiphilus sp. HI0067]